MKRILMIFLLMGAATAVAQSGTYDVTCEGVVVGEATVVDGSVGVVWEPDVQCETPYAIDELDATLHFEADGSITLVPNEEEEPVDEEPVDEEPVEEEPVEGDDDEQVEEDAGRLTGLDRADEVAGENGAHGRERARAAQERGEEAAEEVVEEVEEVLDEKIEIELDVEGSANGRSGVGLGRR